MQVEGVAVRTDIIVLVLVLETGARKTQCVIHAQGWRGAALQVWKVYRIAAGGSRE
jgi:hypothetical protein